MKPRIEPALTRKPRINPWMQVAIRLAVLFALLVFIITVHWIERDAFKDAADPKMFPEQMSVLGLEPWKASKLYGRCDGRADGQVTLDLTAVSAPLEATVREFAASAASCLGDEGPTIPAKRCFRLAAANAPQIEGQVVDQKALR